MAYCESADRECPYMVDDENLGLVCNVKDEKTCPEWQDTHDEE